MTFPEPRGYIAALRESAVPLTGTPDDFRILMRRVGNAPVVLIGGASHGTHEFYRIRAQITKRLIAEKGFNAVAIEGDWPDAYRVNRFVRGRGTDPDASLALAGFRRFPQWMWRNADVLDFVGWLRAYNDALPPMSRVGFYGLDLYSLHASMGAVVQFLSVVDPEAARRAIARYACASGCEGDLQRHGPATSLGVRPSREREVVAQLVELRRAAAAYAQRDDRVAPDDLFFAERNAEVIASAEQYYRAMFASEVGAWNLRDRHMAHILSSLATYLEREQGQARIVVWAHNSHVGDGRATEMGIDDRVTLGQLARQRLGAGAVLIGFTTYGGSVTAASNWDEPVQRMVVRPALEGSVESLFHDVGAHNFALDLTQPGPAASLLRVPRLERAIGVIYRPETERESHYSQVSLSEQFDLVLHYDVTRAVEPMERDGSWTRSEMPETYPVGV
jgi:erythromycin esterase-like protein